MSAKVLTAWVIAMFVATGLATAQLPVELLGGHKKASIDILFFRFFKNNQNANTNWLFFSRTRSTVDYKITTNTYLPAFGLTEAVSYNHPLLKGFAPVAVGQVFNSGVFARAGIQYALVKKNLTIFTWVVCELSRVRSIDYFLLARYTPVINARWQLFTQVESGTTFPAAARKNWSFTQRLRLGLQRNTYQFGLGADFSQAGKTTFTNSVNMGGFLRHEF